MTSDNSAPWRLAENILLFPLQVIALGRHLQNSRLLAGARLRAYFSFDGEKEQL